tara:strand:- start:312 stop:632 length:321 start_codon:yes stop_codon:yes gene_type:complete
VYKIFKFVTIYFLLKDIISNIEKKLEKFVSQYKSLNSEKLKLENEIAFLIQEVASKENRIVELEEKIKLINISKSVDVSNEEIKSTRLKINEYVREIDKCISLLNK